MDIAHRIRSHFAESADLKRASVDVLAPLIARAATMVTDCLIADGKILACGNGGSASDAQHFAAEMVGRFERERPELPAISLATDTSILTAIANDYDFVQVFEATECAEDERLGIGELLRADDVNICVPHSVTARIQEVHLLGIHCLCDAIDASLLGEET